MDHHTFEQHNEDFFKFIIGLLMKNMNKNDQQIRSKLICYEKYSQ